MSYKTGSEPLYQTALPPFTIESPGYEKKPGETIPRRHPSTRDGLATRPVPDVDSVYGLLQRSARLYPDRHAVGSRRLVQVHRETKKVSRKVGDQVKEVDKEWQFYELSQYSFLTYTELHEYVLQLAAGLRHLGLDKGSRLHLYAATHHNWMSMAYACASQAMSIVTAYDTLGPEGLEHSLLQSDADAMYVDPQLLKTAAGPLKKAKTVKFIIYNDSSNFADGTEVEAFKNANPESTLYSVSQLRRLGEEHPIDPVSPTPQDLFCIMYTSGSSGKPKGVPMTHENVLASVAGILACVGDAVSEQDAILAYLPLAHIFELVLENAFVFLGSTLGYGNARTLADTSVRNCAGDMREFKPTILVGVPQVWDTVKKGIRSKLDSAGILTRSLFWGAYGYKEFMSRNRLPFSGALDGIVFGKVRQVAGGHLRYIMNGASGISADTRHFLSMTLAPMFLGYGLTETGANGAIGSPGQYSLSAIGPLAAGIEAKLVSVPDVGYSADASPPQGEIFIRGPAVAAGYFKNAEQTAEAFTEDGWFRTGDVGEFDGVGHLKVIDRVKNLVKMQGGEYVSLEKLEGAYRASRFVANLMVEARSEHPKPVAIVVPNVKELESEARNLGVSGTGAALCHDAKVKGAVLQDLVTEGKKAGLVGMELITGVVLAEDEWTPQSGLVTATQKLNRKAIREHYDKELADAFSGK